MTQFDCGARRVYIECGRNHQEKSGAFCNSPLAGVAQSVEQLICNQPVGGSTPLASTIFQSCNHFATSHIEHFGT